MNEKENVILGLAAISGFIFLISTLALVLEKTLPKDMCYPWNWLPYLFVIIASLGIFVGGVVHYLTLEHFEKKHRLGEIRKRESMLLNCLDEEEREIVKALLNGPLFQSELSKKTGYNKVKVHRIVRRLSGKGVISVEKVGKTNVVRLVLR